MAMKQTKPEHIADWYEQCRLNLIALRGNLSVMDRDNALVEIRKQYDILSKIDRVCKGDAYFAGVPRPRS